MTAAGWLAGSRIGFTCVDLQLQEERLDSAVQAAGPAGLVFLTRRVGKGVVSLESVPGHGPDPTALYIELRYL